MARYTIVHYQVAKIDPDGTVLKTYVTTDYPVAVITQSHWHYIDPFCRYELTRQDTGEILASFCGDMQCGP